MINVSNGQTLKYFMGNTSPANEALSFVNGLMLK